MWCEDSDIQHRGIIDDNSNDRVPSLPDQSIQTIYLGTSRLPLTYFHDATLQEYCSVLNIGEYGSGTYKDFMCYNNYWNVTVCQSIGPPSPPVSNNTCINPRGSEVDHDVCGEKHVDRQIYQEDAPVVETRKISLCAVIPPVDCRI